MFHQDLVMRVDLMLASGPVAGRVRAAWVDRHARKGTGRSDHARTSTRRRTATSAHGAAAVEPHHETRREEAAAELMPAPAPEHRRAAPRTSLPS
jgi:exodeoxyribonuclease-3